MLILSTPPFVEFSDALAKLGETVLSYSSSRFANGELHVSLDGEVSGEECLYIGSIAPPEENLFSLLLLADTLRSEGAKQIRCFLPYMSYSRQDKIEPHRSVAARCLGSLMASVGVTEIITLDLHSSRAAELLNLPVRVLSPAPFIADVLRNQNLRECTLIAPDAGAAGRCEAVRHELQMPNPIVVAQKKRSASSVSTVLGGSVSKTCVIIVDILDTGATLVACSRELRRAGAEDIYVFATHGLFTGERWLELFSLGVRRIWCTNSVPRARNRHSNIDVFTVSDFVAPLIVQGS
jgi:ribose-phosphate pyrophosphokinase